MKTITVIGKRWFRRSYGNTYCSAQIYIDGEHKVKLGPMGGYGDYYFQAAFEWLVENNYLPGVERHQNGSYREAYWQVAERLGFQWVKDVTDVSRQKDL